MLPKTRRLKAGEVKKVIKEGRSLRASFLSVKYSATSSPLRASVVVSKKVAKQAVERNRIRRAVYRALTTITGTGIYVVFVNRVPEDPITPQFREDLVVLIK